MIESYLGPLENVDGFGKRELPPNHVECPKCGGYGGWNLKVDAYGKGVHFKAHCGQCNGWGYVLAGSLDATCIHEMEHTRNLGRCYNLYTCKKCGRKHEVDSSD